ncbi:subtilisin-like serine endopeptidase family protein [Actinidia rufa]|uniref:Subtilisin-like serine endopeptidase family protein n=1 Tax=Actinidia rufa TaxID=165716 RepID=A0A7J0DTD9_9ERIC|nr:subtilisin-like serine endopeptidase family protein [Actinidia rufa]
MEFTNLGVTTDAVGVVVSCHLAEDTSFVVPLPASILNNNDIGLVHSYFTSTKIPKASILGSEIVRNLDAPVVATFSLKEPNVIIPEILKPGITAPGVDILVAYSPTAPPSDEPCDRMAIKFNLMSRTSMACPHVAGVAAYVKSLHPDWSPLAIKSALMTTGKNLNP